MANLFFMLPFGNMSITKWRLAIIDSEMKGLSATVQVAIDEKLCLTSYMCMYGVILDLLSSDLYTLRRHIMITYECL